MVGATGVGQERHSCSTAEENQQLLCQPQCWRGPAHRPHKQILLGLHSNQCMGAGWDPSCPRALTPSSGLTQPAPGWGED